MADPAVVQSVLNPGDASTALATNFGSLPTVGNYVVVAVTSGSSTNPASALVDDNQGHTYTKQKTLSDTNSGTAQLWWAKVATSSGTFTVNAKNMGSSNDSVVIMEFSGVDASSPILDSTTAFVTTFTATLATSGIMASPQINAYMLHVLINAATGLTYTARGDLAILKSQNTVVSGQLIAVGGGKLTAHGPNIVAQIGISGTGDAFASVSMILRGTDPQVAGPGGGRADGRYARSSTFWSGTSTLGQKRSAWGDDALDGGIQDLITDNPTRGL